MKLGAGEVIPPKESVEYPYKQFKGTIVTGGEKVNLKSSPPIYNMKELLKMIKEKQAQQAQPPSPKVLGDLVPFFDTSNWNPENTKEDAPPPSQKYEKDPKEIDA